MNNPLPLLVGRAVRADDRLRARLPGGVSRAGQLQGPVWDWSSRSEYEADVAKATQALAPVYAKYEAMPVEEMARDPQAMAIGERLFMNNCAQCHGSDARGSKGFPNLTDKRLAARRHAREDRPRPSPRAASA
jgi:cbb3-type cytochrome c oxidase subunit III